MRLSIQLYTLRDQLSQDVPGTLKALKDAGLEYVEMAGDYGKSAAEWKTILDELGLKLSGSHIGIDQFENNFDQVIADAKTLDNKFLIVPWIGSDRYANGWAAFGKQLDEIGAKVKAAGLTLCYHNHAFEFESVVDGKHGLTELYDNASADNLKAEIDCAWVQIGKADPADYVLSLKGRVPLVHLKDFDPTKTPQWTPAGEGTVDYAKLIPACEAAGVEFACVELDESPGEPMDAVKKSIAFLQSKGIK